MAGKPKKATTRAEPRYPGPGPQPQAWWDQFYARVEALAKQHEVDAIVERVRQQVVERGGREEDFPPQLYNRYFWLSVKLAEHQVLGRKGAPKRGAPDKWTPEALDELRALVVTHMCNRVRSGHRPAGWKEVLEEVRAKHYRQINTYDAIRRAWKASWCLPDAAGTRAAVLLSLAFSGENFLPLPEPEEIKAALNSFG